MKKFVFSKTLALILCFMLAFSAFSVNVFAADEDADIDMGEDVIIETLPDAYVSASGNDSNAGTEAAPFATLEKALKRVSNNGRIHIVGTYTVPAGMNWVDRNVDSVTITGGTLSLASNDFVIGYNITFKDITISGSKAVYANGNNVTFESGANASAVIVYGGSNTGETLESTNITINGGTLGTVYGGSSVACTINQVSLTINGGTVSGVFGGNNASNLTGNVSVYINGGTISDKIFGGCNNEYTYKSSFLGNIGASITWNSAYYVTGKVDVIVSENVTINTNNSSGTDKAFFAHSRHKTLSSSEDSSIIFTSQTAYNNNSSKFGTKATNSALGTSNNLCGAGMGTDEASAADNVHIHGITTDDTNDTITEGCTLSSGTEVDPCESATVALTLDNKASLVYSGEEITPMTAVVNGTLTLGEPVITYSDNVNPGTATATMSYGGASVSKTFTIEKQTQKAPALVAVPESISGLADGEIYGLTTAMEISTDGTTYNAVTDTTAKFAAGTYYVRYAETDYKKASEPKTVVIAAGEKLVVTFIADGNTVATKEVSYGETLTDIPAVPAKVGYDKTAPYWDVTDFSNITSDITANAVYTINTYTVKFVADGVSISEQTIEYGADAEVPEIPAKDGYTMIAPYWDAEANNVNSYALDINGNGSVTLDDVNTLARYLAGWNETLSDKPYMG